MTNVSLCKRILLAFILLLSHTHGIRAGENGGGVQNSEFQPQSPVHYEIQLAGNFGEPRPHHFHGGIDVKTDRVEGKPIFAIADGYVERLTVGLYGFGNAVFVRHPQGYTSVYCHLKAFTPRLQAALRRWQYSHQSYQADVHLKATDCPVAQGDLIAISGNTGSSQAPHLHLEIHDTRSWNMLDPLNFLGHCLTDHTPPQAHAFMAYPQPGEGVFNGSAAKQDFGFGSHHLTREFTAWGKVGFGLWANDYMEATYNNYGIRTTVLTVDGREVFRSDVDNIPVNANRLVNSWGDYHHYLRSNVWYMKSFVDPGNTLPMLHADEDRGIVCFDQERDYQLSYLLTDFAGNTSEYTFVVRGQRRPIPPRVAPSLPRLMRWDRVNHFALPGMQLVIGKHLLAEDMELKPDVKRQPGALSDRYTLSDRSYPLVADARLSLKCHRQVKDPSKLYVVCHWGTERFMGGTCNDDGWVTAPLRELGAAYELACDDVPPQVNPVSLGETISMSITDGASGIRTYRGYIDGRFVLFEEVAKSSVVRCNLRQTPIRPTGKMHHLKFVAIDNRNNQQTYETQIKY